jgi:hypothetical protein
MGEHPGLNQDFVDILAALSETGAEFIIVGAHAMAAHGVPRATGDLDLFVRPSSENARRVVQALLEFGAPITSHGVRTEDFSRPGTVYQVGLPPRRIDFLTEISGVSFDEAWADRIEIELAGRPVAFLGETTLKQNKAAADRDKDRVDLRLLEHKRPK